MRVANSVLELIGQTPMVRLRRIQGEGVATVYVKLERFNPGGSVKDRPALFMVEEAERSGRLRPGMTLIEPTSGNTGIGIAMVAAAKGYEAVLVMPDSMTRERIDILRAYGARVVLTPGAQRMQGAVEKARALKLELGDRALILGQFENPANPDAHRHTTASEILSQMDGRLDVFVAAAGTGGTVTGTGETLKKALPDLKVWVVEPAGSPVLSGGQPGPHKIIGTSPGFVPQILNTDVYDRIFLARDDDAVGTARRLASEEGILVGASSGATVFAALQAAREIGPGGRVVALCPDTGERYLSADVF